MTLQIINTKLAPGAWEADAAVQAERERMFAERQATIDAMLAAENDYKVGPLVRAVDFVLSTIPPDAVPAFLKTMRTLKSSTDFTVVLSNVETRHLRAQAEAVRLRAAETAAADLRSIARRRAEIDQGAL